MGRRRKGNKVDGWVIIDKAEGMTSTQVVGKVRWLLTAQKAGHGGTLDPLATGVLPIALGEATKTVPFVMDGTKIYEFTIIWGIARDTDDREGAVIATSDVRPDAAAIDAVLGDFTGDIDQVPPKYSAIHVDGKRAYDLARAGEEVTLKSRRVRIDDLQRLARAAGTSETWFRVTCGKGTYVRSLARDIARALGTQGHVGSLRRTRTGPFFEGHAISLDMLEQLSHSARADEAIRSVLTALDDIPALAVTEQQAKAIRHGQPLQYPAAAQGTVRIMAGDQLIALATVDAGLVKPTRVFNLE